MGTSLTFLRLILLFVCVLADNASGENLILKLASSTSTYPFFNGLVQSYMTSRHGAPAGVSIEVTPRSEALAVSGYNEGLFDVIAADGLSTMNESIAIPLGWQSIAIVYNLRNSVPGTLLSLDMITVAGIFNGTIRNWADARIAAMNPGRVLPNAPIRVVLRRDGSGTTRVFTGHLAGALGSAWSAGSFSMPSVWPELITNANTTIWVNGVADIVHTIETTPYSISYLETVYQVKAGLSAFNIQKCSASSPVAAIASWEEFPRHINDTNLFKCGSIRMACTYPLMSMFYIFALQHNPSCARARETARFLFWIDSNPLVLESTAHANLMVTISATTLSALPTITCNGQSPFQTMLSSETCPRGYELTVSTVASAPASYASLLSFQFYTCSLCPVGFYDIDGRGLKCTTCPPGAVCLGGSQILIERGSWARVIPPEQRPASTLKMSSLFTMPCESNRDSCCPLGDCMMNVIATSSAASDCLAGWMGIACSQCERGHSAWYNTCWSCAEYGVGWPAIFQVGAVFIFNVLVAIIVLFIPQNSERIAVETMAFHFQIVARMLQLNEFWSGSVDKSWANGVLNLLIGARTLDDTMMYVPSLGCLIGASALSQQLAFLLMPGIYLCMPAILVLVIGIPWFRAKKLVYDRAMAHNVGSSSMDGYVESDLVHPDRQSEFLRTILVNGILRLIMVAGTPLIHRSLQVMKCTKLPGTDLLVLVLAPSEQCYTQGHISLITVACILLFIFVVLVPLWVLYMVGQPEHVLNAMQPRYNLIGHLRRRYQHDCGYFVVFDLALERLLILALLVFLPTKSSTQTLPLSMGLAFVVILYLRTSLLPYTHHADNMLKFFSIASMLGICFIGVVQQSAQGRVNGTYYTELTCIFFLLCCPIISIVVAMRQLLRRYRVVTAKVRPLHSGRHDVMPAAQSKRRASVSVSIGTTKPVKR